MIALIARHELGRLARSAQTWTVAAAFAALAGYLYLSRLERWIGAQEQIRLQDHAPGVAGFLGVEFLAPLAIVLGVLAPLYAMRSFADGFRDGSWTLWQSSPVPLAALALGKFLAVLAVMTLLASLAVVLVLVLGAFTSLDAGVVASGAAGLVLCTAAMSATGLYFSALVRQPLAGATGAIALIMLLWLIGSVPSEGMALRALAELSPARHLAGFFQGFPGTGDAAYFVVFTALFLALTVLRLDRLRHDG